MTYLLDVNVIIALIDPCHAFHEPAHDWFASTGHNAWATCPITENGVLRILGHSKYPKGPGTPAGAAQLFAPKRHLPGHSFWGDEVSLLSETSVRLGAIASAAQITDTYLMTLARYRGGTLATFDRQLSPVAVDGGREALLIIA